MPEFLENKLEGVYGKGKPITLSNMGKNKYIKDFSPVKEKKVVKMGKLKTATNKKLGVASKMVKHHHIGAK